MTDFSIFTDDHLSAAVDRLTANFQQYASEGYLSLAADTHAALAEIRAEIERRIAATYPERVA